MGRHAVYDKDGNVSYHTHMVDIKEAIRSGRWFAENPKAKEVATVQPIVEASLGEDIAPLKSEIEQTKKERPTRNNKT